MTESESETPARLIDSRDAWLRLLATVAVGTIGGVGMWSVVVALPAVQADFGVDRGSASLPYTLTMFGLFQGGIVPSYAIIVREFFPAREAGRRVGWVVMATLFGMALGGWASGEVFDLTGSYRAVFLNGIGWNLLNLAIVVWLLRRPGARFGRASAPG